ncbi:PPE domain-containing protein [[Mycobacterium] nativiensis]|uniref:PPE domain-containing protein n=1 Tax=[Mycobacterium] nativiensis TaxID=2855503 RepID=A0ABU5Y254_9MYCO|nr:PPE domain-containing protein [Mycolicibacter sp. MYC340]MEB3034223.1 PPE domain-containing protein [Mycolicibacter sp. MYC340]
MGSPPEVHSALLAAGPGPGPLLAAAGAWSSLSGEYAAVAQELAAVIGAVGSGQWRGTGADSYAAAHGPYLGWLAAAEADSAAAAVQCEVAASAYVSALAAMPTLPELAANHAVHAVLVATNFFGINTVPIAVNEADYARMWVQAATTMATYEAVAGAAVASAPHTAAAPKIAADQGQSTNWLHDFLDKLGISDSLVAHDPKGGSPLDLSIAQLLKNVGINWDPTGGTLNGHVYDYYANANEPIWYLARALELLENFQFSGSQNPTAALQYLLAVALFDWPTHVAQLATTLSQSAPLLVAAAGAVAAPAGALGGLGGLAGLAVPEPVVAAAPVPLSAPAVPTVVSSAPGVPAAAAPAAASPPAAPGPPAGPSPAPAPPPAGVQAFAYPYVVGGGPGCTPRVGTGSGMGAAASAKKKAPEPDSAAVAAQAATRSATRRRRRAARQDHEVIKVGAEASDHGAGELGFAGSNAKPDVAAVGLTRLAGTLDGATRVPLLPETWRGTGSGDCP